MQKESNEQLDGALLLSGCQNCLPLARNDVPCAKPWWWRMQWRKLSNNYLIWLYSLIIFSLWILSSEEFIIYNTRVIILGFPITENVQKKTISWGNKLKCINLKSKNSILFYLNPLSKIDMNSDAVIQVYIFIWIYLTWYCNTTVSLFINV